jgi:hypothetical protein
MTFLRIVISLYLFCLSMISAQTLSRLSRGKTGTHFFRIMHLAMNGGTAGRDKTPAAPCRFFAILAGKCGFAGQPERRDDRSGARGIGNANRVLT